jgi:hypothetical protein
MDTTAVWTEPAPLASDFEHIDALGLRQLEQLVADWFWPGFSDRTERAGYYPMVTYGLWVAEEAARRAGLGQNDDTVRVLFNRWERLWAIAVCAHHGGTIPAEDRMRGAVGAERALERFGRGRVPLAYPLTARGRELGALGAYLSSLRAFELVAEARLRVTPLGWRVASWMWGSPDEGGRDRHELVLAALDPRSTTVPSRSLTSLGERATLSGLAQRDGLRQLLWECFFGPAAAARAPVLAEMTRARLAWRDGGGGGVRDFLENMVRGTGGVRVGTTLRNSAAMALVLVDLGTALTDIFAATCDLVKAQGFHSTWSECVQHAVTPDTIRALNDALSRWRQLGMEQQIGVLPGCGRLLAFVMKRLNTQNMYNVFESVLTLHTMAQQALSQGNGWLARQGEAVFLRGPAIELAPGELRWEPQLRFGAVDALLDDLVQSA